jgi:hypothetical protein
MGDKTNIQNLFENIQRKISVGKTRQRQQHDIKMSLKSEDMDWMQLAQDRIHW